MCNVILMVLLAVVSSNAMAEWESIDVDDDSTTYIDKSTIRKHDQFAKMWTMFDYRKQQKDSHGISKSQTMLIEFDCDDEQFRFLAINYYSGKNGQGKSTFTNSKSSDFSPVPPHTKIQVAFDIACVKK